MFNEDATQLTENILLYARHFLDQAGEFYPFAAVIQHDGKIRSVAVSIGEEYPDSDIVLDELEKALKDGLARDVYRSGAVGLDVYINRQQPSKLPEKITAVEIRLYSKGTSIKKHFIYHKQESGYEFEEFVVND